MRRDEAEERGYAKSDDDGDGKHQAPGQEFQCLLGMAFFTPGEMGKGCEKAEQHCQHGKYDNDLDPHGQAPVASGWQSLGAAGDCRNRTKRQPGPVPADRLPVLLSCVSLIHRQPGYEKT